MTAATDLRLRVVRASRRPTETGRAPLARTPHFEVLRDDHGLEVRHTLTLDRLDNDLAGMLAEELFASGVLSQVLDDEPVDNDLFERLFVGVVRSTATDPALAWRAFYANTLTAIRECWAAPGARAPGSQIADMAPVYERAARLAPPGTVLDLGSCFGFFPLLLAENGAHQVVASDLVPGSMRLLGAVAHDRSAPLRTLVCDARRVPLPHRAADTVTVLHLLEHLDAASGRAVLREAVRLAAKWVVVAVPFEETPNAAFGHVRRFDLPELRALGAETGTPYTVCEHHGGWLVLQAS